MHSISLNIVLQLVEALVSISFYESIQKSEFKLKNPVAIIIGYIIMCALNLMFNYNVVVNIIVMLVFHLVFAKVVYKQSVQFSLFSSILIACLVMLTEFIVLNILDLINGETMRYFINNTYTYILLIVFSKSLLFVLLKVVSEIINKSQSNERINFTFLIFPLSLLLILVNYFIRWEMNSTPNLKNMGLN
jgi:hypothetical protein